jgi:hypothetical protein
MSLHHSKRIGALLVAGLLAAAGCSSGGSDGKDATVLGTLAGTVTGSTGAAIAGVVVTPSPAAVPATTTDSKGKYSFDVPAGSYTLTFTGDNLEPATSASATVARAETTTVDQVMAASTLKVSVNLPAALKNGGPAGFDTTVSGISASATLDGTAITPDSVTWTITDYYGTKGPPTSAAPTPDSGATTSFDIPDFESVREGANAWMSDRYGTTGTEEDFEYIQAPERDQLLSFGVEQVRSMSYKLVATVKAGSRTSTAGAVVSPVTISSGANTLPLGMMVVGNAAPAATYAWKLEFLPMSATSETYSDVTAAQLRGADGKNPYLVPTTAGVYRLTNGMGAPLYFRISTYHGVGTADTDRGSDGVACADCHNGDYSLAGKFAEWNASAHANANFADPFATPTALFKLGVTGGEGTHYTEGCISCHVVGYSKVPSAANKGFDDVAAAEGWTFPTTYDAAAWDTVTAKPGVLHRAGIQCENCHGPLEPTDHSQPEGIPSLFGKPVAPVASMSAGICMVCHDALTHHDRGSLWSASGHANVELAMEEGAGSTSCARCHSAEGFMLYLPRQQAGTPGNLTDISSLSVATVHSQTCQTCHDPHTATLRVSGDTKQVAGMFQVQNAGAGALCVICHNSRSGAIKQGTYAITSSSLGRLGPHTACQGDMFAGRNAFFMSSLTAADAATNLPYKSAHSFMTDTCADCHVKWVPEDVKAQYQVWNTNHTFRSSLEICSECHGAGIGERIQDSISEKMTTLQGRVSNVLSNRLLGVGFDTAKGARTDPTTGARLTDPASRTVTSADVQSIAARTTASAIVVTLKDGSQFQVGIGNICPAGTAAASCDASVSPASVTPLLSAGDTNTQRWLKAYFNLLFVNNDGSKGVHNPAFAAAVLDNATAQLAGLVIPTPAP